jgi:hypothetical protein
MVSTFGIGRVGTVSLLGAYWTTGSAIVSESIQGMGAGEASYGVWNSDLGWGCHWSGFWGRLVENI